MFSPVLLATRPSHVGAGMPGGNVCGVVTCQFTDALVAGPRASRLAPYVRLQGRTDGRLATQ